MTRDLGTARLPSAAEVRSQHSVSALSLEVLVLIDYVKKSCSDSKMSGRMRSLII